MSKRPGVSIVEDADNVLVPLHEYGFIPEVHILEYNQVFEQLYRWAMELDCEKLVIFTCYTKEEISRRVVEMVRYCLHRCRLTY